MRNGTTTGSRGSAIALALLLLLPLAATPAAAQKAWPARSADPDDVAWWSSPQVKTQLGLSAEQEKAIETILFDAGEAMIDIRAAIEKARLELTRALAAEPIDEAAARKAIDKLVESESAGARLRHTSRFNVAQVLTKEQRVGLMKAMERRARETPRPGRAR